MKTTFSFTRKPAKFHISHNGILPTSNGFMQDEQNEGFQVEIADWHAEMNFLNESVQYYNLQMYNHKPYDMKETLLTGLNVFNAKNANYKDGCIIIQILNF